jgi:hypothetical protein
VKNEVGQLFVVQPRLHPIQVVRHLRERYGDCLVFRFSCYTHISKSRMDCRESFAVPAREITPIWLQDVLSKLGSKQELAMESRVIQNGRLRHVPMLDFQGMSKGQLIAVMDALPDEYRTGMQVYFSGRSFHAYFLRLVTAREWTRFMGSALLCRGPRAPAIDNRWIGHRLVGGYAALRWSCSSGRHQEFPIRVSPKTLDLPFAVKRRALARLADSPSVVPDRSAR